MDKSKILAKLLLELTPNPAAASGELGLFNEAMKMGLAKLLLNPVVTAEKKKTLIDKLFGPNLSAEFKQFINYLIDINQLKPLPAITARYRSLVKTQKNVQDVKVTSATPLSDQSLTEIKDKLRAAFHIEPVITYQEDKNVLGGVSIQVGDQIFDNTLAKQINDLYKQLVG